MLHTQYVFVYGNTCILVINFAPLKVKSWLCHCLKRCKQILLIQALKEDNMKTLAQYIWFETKYTYVNTN